MKKTAHLIIILLIGSVALITTGCQGQNSSDINLRKNRLLAAENLQLKNDLAQCKSEIAKLQNEKTAAEKDCENKINMIMDFTSDQNQKTETLTQENENLKKQLAELKK